MTPEVIEGFRLSSQQKHAWRLGSKDPARHAACAILVEGRLESEMLEEALRLLAERHEILRTTFHLLPGMTAPVQVIAESLSPAVRQAEAADIERLFAAERRIAFDYERGPLLRATVVRSAPERHVIVLCVPVLCADRLTLRNLAAELGRCYAAATGNGQLSEAPMQYADYAEWQNELRHSDDESAKAARAFWLRTARSVSAMPFPFQQAHTVDAQMPLASLSFPLEIKAGALNAPEDVLLFTCWQILLGRLTGALEICTAKLFTGRRFEKLRGAVGPFARYLPLTTHIDEGLSFNACVEKLAETTRLAEEWQEYFDLEEVGVAHGFDYELVTEETYEAPGVSFTPLGHSECEEGFDLHLSCARAGDTLRATLHYNCAAFHAGDVEQIAGRLQTLLTDAITHPEKAIDRLEILSSSERLRLLSQFDDPRVDEPTDECLQQLFEARVRENPESVAVVFEEQRMSYRELDRRANRLAYYLRDCGVKPEVCVGLCLKRSPELLVGMLGVLKAGGAYVPLDADDPAGRRAHICAEAQLRVILTQEDLRHLWSDFAGKVICLDGSLDFLVEGADTSPLISVSPDNLAYVVHTSGSTGRPKGVLATHRGAVNYLRYLATEFPLSRPDVVLQNASPTFDASVREIFGTFNAGATLVLLSQADFKEPRTLVSQIRESGVTALLSVVPTMLGALLDAAGDAPSSLAGIRLILSSGEPLPISYCQRAREVFGDGVLVVNQYGPTECAMTSSFYAVQGPLSKAGTIPIGKAIRNRQLYLLDKHGQPVPFGVPGEVYIGGPGIARGYLRQPDLTAESFVPNPFSKTPGARLYRTGDQARHLRDGQLEFLGRLDRQVKLRGLRIEPGEIEAALTDHRGVKTAAVVMREDGAANQRLVAYVVPSKAWAANGHRRYKLPNGMMIAQQSKVETDFMYEEIFNQQVYLKHGLTLHEGDCVFDVGANVGLFTLFVHQHCRDVTIYAFEPAPPLFEILSLNAAFHGVNVRRFNCGLSDTARNMAFTFYPKSSGMSSFYADATEEKEVLRSIMINQLEKGVAGMGPLMEHSDALLEERFRKEVFTCQLRTISDVIEEENIERIDLLKIDAQKSEADILNGIRDEDWKKIRQLVIEVHDLDGRLGKMVSLLEEHGFEVIAEQDEVFSGSVLHYVYARAPEDAQRLPAHCTSSHRPAASPQADKLLTVDELREHLKARLPEYMLPSTFVLLEAMPLTPTGKVDRRALPAPEQVRPDLSQRYVAPRTPVEEEMTAIWTEVLDIDCAGIHDNFFELGGHSLLAIQLAARISEEFQINLPMARLFEAPTIAELSLVVTQAQAEQEDAGELAQMLAELKSLEAPESRAD